MATCTKKNEHVQRFVTQLARQEVAASVRHTLALVEGNNQTSILRYTHESLALVDWIYFWKMKFI